MLYLFDKIIVQVLGEKMYINILFKIKKNNINMSTKETSCIFSFDSLNKNNPNIIINDKILVS